MSHINIWIENIILDGASIQLGEQNGIWFSCHSKPYFCFEGSTRSQVIDLASRALTWYRSRVPPAVRETP